mmetsp:Transcript_19435/g.61021  ORF Transcript_19435/g.61021 Transcript_19435/m.61021 type:complete len:263 (-) Transcript_19435:33-821(-)
MRRGEGACSAEPEGRRGGGLAPGRELQGAGAQAPSDVPRERRQAAAEAHRAQGGARPLGQRLEEGAPRRPHLGVALTDGTHTPHGLRQEAVVVPVGKLAVGRCVEAHAGGRLPLQGLEVSPSAKLPPHLRLRQAPDHHGTPQTRWQLQAAQLADLQSLHGAGAVGASEVACTSTQSVESAAAWPARNSLRPSPRKNGSRHHGDGYSDRRGPPRQRAAPRGWLALRRGLRILCRLRAHLASHRCADPCGDRATIYCARERDCE